MITAIGFSGGWKPGQLVIQGATFDPSAHCFGLVNDGRTIIDATAAHGVKERPFNELDYSWVKFIQLAPLATHSQRIVLEYLLRGEIGKGYDFGFTLGWPFLGRKWQDDDHWACSELIGAMLVQAGIMPQPERLHRLTPRNLRRRLEMEMRRFIKPPVGIMVHHSLTRDGKTVDAAGIRYYHMHPAHNGETISNYDYNKLFAQGASGLKPAWEETGYARLYERVNGVLTKVDGRPLEFHGAHCPGFNETHWGVCIVGNFDLAPPDDDLLDFAAADIIALMTEYGMDRRNLEYHCDHSHKTCPGSQFPKDGFRLAIAGELPP